MKRIDLANKVFGRLRVLKSVRSVKTSTGSYTMWKCICECGQTTSVRTSHLTEGRTKSCGCLFVESLTSKPRGRKPNGTAYLRYVFGYYHKNAQGRKFEFALNFDSFCALVVKSCHYCGAEPAQGRNKSRLDRPTVFNGIIKHNGLDRIDSKIGYVPENVVPCCAHCNYAKRRMTEPEFRDWSHRLYHHFVAPAAQKRECG